ncbi:hypothetical protein [Aquimarina sp. AU119]|uniref:hypothetical protein n=1 Tax=Aquimarina sp. AU119 TaxID=2108528 RepID=UPI000D68F7B6|nr:hypothetical protein [Aquimarina sp. AU119]
MKLFTENRTDVTLRVKRGLTSFFECPKEASIHARQTGSYVYNIFKNNKDKKRVFAGYGVPK